MRTSFKVKGQTQRSNSKVKVTPTNAHTVNTQYGNIFRTGRPTNFKLVTQTEHEDPHQRQGRKVTWSKVKLKCVAKLCVCVAYSLEDTQMWSTACWITEPMWTSWMTTGSLLWLLASFVFIQSPSTLRLHILCLHTKLTALSRQFGVFHRQA